MIEGFCIFTVIISKFAFLQVQQKILFLYPFKFSQSMFSITPSVYSSKTKSQLKVFYTVYMIFTISEFIFRVLHSVVSQGCVINQSVISFPAIRINHTLVQFTLVLTLSLRNSDNIGISSFAEQFLTIWVQTLPSRFNIPNTGVLFAAPLPLLPLTRLAPFCSTSLRLQLFKTQL